MPVRPGFCDKLYSCLSLLFHPSRLDYRRVSRELICSVSSRPLLVAAGSAVTQRVIRAYRH